MKSNSNITLCDSLLQSIIKVYAFSYSEPETINFFSTETVTILIIPAHACKNKTEFDYFIPNSKLLDIFNAIQFTQPFQDEWRALSSLLMPINSQNKNESQNLSI